MIKNTSVASLSLVVLVIATIGPATAQSPHAGHSMLASTAEPARDPDAPIAPRLENLGDLHYEISTTSEDSQFFFNQGLRMVYAFNHAEAVRAFKEAARHDANAAMPHWGEALALGQNINDPLPKERELEALAALGEAEKRLDGATDKEKALISALAARYSPEEEADRATLNQAWVEAMAALAEAHPRDPDIQTIYAAAIMNTSPWDYWLPTGEPKPSLVAAREALERTIRTAPDHPGAHHYYIHLMEAHDPDEALPSADRLGSLMPAAGHLVHMPAHIYIRTGNYHKASEANVRAIAADEDYIAQCQAQGLYPEGYYPHNIHFLWAAATFEGRSRVAIDAAEKVARQVPQDRVAEMPNLQGFLATPLFAYVRFGRWQQILEQREPPKDQLFVRAMYHYARGLALTNEGDQRAARAELKQLRKLGKKKPMGNIPVSFEPATSVARLAGLILEGEMLAHRGKIRKALPLLYAAVELQDSFRYSEPPTWHYPVRQTLGAVLASGRRNSEAKRIFEQDLAENRRNGWSLFGLLQVTRALGDSRAAAELENQLRDAWQYADVELSEAVFR